MRRRLPNSVPLKRIAPRSRKLPAYRYPRFETVEVGGLPVARLDRAGTTQLLLDLATKYRRGDRPWISTSVNGQVLSNAARDAVLREAMLFADVISADGQPMVLASRQVTGFALPERVATTDLFHDIARAAKGRKLTMYFLGASSTENARAVANIKAAYPYLRIVGQMHGYHSHAGWIKRVAEINAIGPDLLWVALGVPREQQFYMRFAHALPNVGVIKTSGGLFNFLSASASRAPQWMQNSGFEWVYRLQQEPRRLLLRYLTTSPHAAMLMLTKRKPGRQIIELGQDRNEQ
ncbi:MAG TPA: WecB/TagA/CpsF family glycosyltransferase [Devosia sp.]|nr:WecB/TagA/CpsF family glycosyltransferase [Devosia sp.]